MLDKFPQMKGDIFKAIFDLVNEHPPLTVVTVNGCLTGSDPIHINAQMIVSDATGATIYQTKYGSWQMWWPEDGSDVLEGFTDPAVNVHLQILPRSVLVIDNFKAKYHIEISSADLTAKDFFKLFSSPLDSVHYLKKLYTPAGIRFTVHVQAIVPAQTTSVTPAPQQAVATVHAAPSKPVPSKQESHAEYDIDPEVIKNDNRKTNLESVLGDVLEQSKEIVNHIHKEKEKNPNAFNPPEEVQPEMPHSLDDLKALTDLHMLDHTSDDTEPEDPVFNQVADDAVEFEDVVEEPKPNDVNTPRA